MIYMHEDERRLNQRNFYLRLSPFDGHEIAENEAGFTSPSEDALEAEIRDTLSLWLTLQQGKSGEIIANCAWWMTQYMDPERRMDATTGVIHLDKLTSFAVSVIGQLIDNGCITLNEKVDIPDILLSSEMGSDMSVSDFFSNLENLWKEVDEDE